MAQRIGLRLMAAGLIAATWTIAAAQEPAKKFIMHEAPKPIAAIQFEDGDGKPRSFSDFRGKVVVLNIWATWCVPCRKEMPTLDRLQIALGGPDFEVVPLSIDRGGTDVVRKFFAEVGIKTLAIYIDSSGKATRELGAFGLPTTLLVNRKGQEIGRLIGPAEWDAPEMVAFFKCTISREDVNSKFAAAPPCSVRKLDLPASGPGTNGRP